MPYAQLDNDGRVKAVVNGGPGIPCEWDDIGRIWTGSVFEDAAPEIPVSVTPRQFRQALTAIGLRATVEAAIAGADQDTKDWYEYSNAFERANPVLNAMAVTLGKSGAEVDALFELAKTL